MFFFALRNPTSENQIVPQKCRQYSFFSVTITASSYPRRFNGSVDRYPRRRHPAAGPGGGGGFPSSTTPDTNGGPSSPCARRWHPRSPRKVALPGYCPISPAITKGAQIPHPNILHLPHLNIFPPSKSPSKSSPAWYSTPTRNGLPLPCSPCRLAPGGPGGISHALGTVGQGRVGGGGRYNII